MNRVHQLVSENLLCAGTCAFAVGISVSSTNLYLQIFCLFLTGTLTFLFFRYHWKKSATTMVLFFFVGLGMLFGNDIYSPPDDPSHVYHLVAEKREAVVIGIVNRLQGFDGQVSRAEIKCDFIRLKGEKDFIPAKGRISLRLKDIWPKGIMPGDRVVIRANLSRPQTLRTAGSFNYIHYLAEKDIWITGTIESPLLIHRINSSPFMFHSLLYSVERARIHIGTAFDRSLGPQLSGIYKAIVIGERSGINPDLLEKFKGSGCVHILAISGMHMSIIGVFLFSVFYWLLRRSEWLILHLDIKKTAMAACLLPLCFYALLAGSSTPVMRSLIMTIVVISALCVNRQKSIFATLSLAMLCLLVWMPSNLFSVSFQLTFAAVASIAAISPILSGLLFLKVEEGKDSVSLLVRLRNWVIAALAVSVSATVGTAPLLLFWFNRISLVGPLANLVVEPLICFWSLTLGFLACPCVFLFPDLATILLHIGAWGVKASIAAVTFFNGISFACVWLPTPSPFLITIYYASLFVILTGSKYHKGIRSTAWLVFPATLFFFVFPPSELFKHLQENSRITFIDVGQGSASLLELPTGKRALIDGGGPASPNFDTGEKVIGPFLWKKGIKKINLVIITHPDADHYNGLPFVIEHFSPDIIWINGSSGHDNGYTELMGLAKKLHIPRRTPVGDEQLLKAGKSDISIIENPITRPGHEQVSANDRGLVIKFTTGEFSAVFPGDISKKVESLLVFDRPERLKAQILLSPHHGSSTSNSMAFLQAVHPKFLIVSAGTQRRGIFPSRDLAEKSSICGIKMLTTALSGCVTVATDGKSFSLTAGDGITADRHIPRGP